MNINSSNFFPDLKNGETQIIFQRHAKYDKETGEMIDIDVTTEVDYNYFKTLLSSISDEERENIFVLFIASDTKNVNGIERAIFSTQIAKSVVGKLFQDYGISSSHIVNNVNFGTRIKSDSNLIEPKMFIDNTGYLDFLKNKYNGINREFWIAFEEDLNREYRLEIFGEGPDEIVDRAFSYLTTIQRYSNYFHSVNPNARLIVWSGTHYDLISPFIKQMVAKLDKEEEVSVDYNAGIGVTISKDGKFITSINGIYYDLGDLVSMQLHRHY